jgi:hypothetical protein
MVEAKGVAAIELSLFSFHRRRSLVVPERVNAVSRSLSRRLAGLTPESWSDICGASLLG